MLSCKSRKGIRRNGRIDSLEIEGRSSREKAEDTKKTEGRYSREKSRRQKDTIQQHWSLFLKCEIKICFFIGESSIAIYIYMCREMRSAGERGEPCYVLGHPCVCKPPPKMYKRWCFLFSCLYHWRI